MKHLRLRIAAIAAATMLSAMPGSAHAWGAIGHRAIAEMAARHLSPQTMHSIEDLLGANPASLVEASTWADDIRKQRRETAPWHFVNIPLGASGYNAARDCRDNECVVAQIEAASQRLGDQEISKPIRIEALKFLIHFVGDIHQPLHAVDDHDQGGNAVWVHFEGKTEKLHALWDTGLVAKLGTSSPRIAAKLLPQITNAKRGSWQHGMPEAWANESYAIARDFIYARSRGKNKETTPIILSANYLLDAEPIVEEQLEKAAVRLAWILNNLFDGR